jgi:tetratricopeptide (TPR) repeat protein
MIVLVTALCLLAQTSATGVSAASSFDRARQLQQSRRWPEAEQAYRAHLKQFGPSAEALANLGAVLVQQEKFAEAVGNYQQALRLAPQLTPIHLNLGLAFMKSGRPSDAAASFSQFLAKDPANRQARQLRAMAYLEAEKFGESVSDYRSLMPSDDLTIRLGLATALARNGSAAEARSVLDPILASDAPDVQFVYGQALFEEGNFQKALEVLRQVEKAKPDMPQLRFYLGAIYWRQQQTDAAIEEWRKEHRANPESFQANYTMGAALAFTSAEEAEPYLRKAVKLRPKHPQSLYQLGKLLWLRAKSPETVAMLEQAVKSQPDYREAHYLLATVYQSLGRRVDAQREFAVVKKLSEAEVQKSRDLFESGK